VLLLPHIHDVELKFDGIFGRKCIRTHVTLDRAPRIENYFFFGKSEEVIYLTLLEALAVTEGAVLVRAPEAKQSRKQVANPSPISVCLYVVFD
jgi:hypothetical protein